MFRRLIIGMFLIALPASVSAETAIATFDNRGQCIAAWSHLNNDKYGALRKSGDVGSAAEMGGWTYFYCARVGDAWVLYAQ